MQEECISITQFDADCKQSLHLAIVNVILPWWQTHELIVADSKCHEPWKLMDHRMLD